MTKNANQTLLFCYLKSFRSFQKESKLLTIACKLPPDLDPTGGSSFRPSSGSS